MGEHKLQVAAWGASVQERVRARDALRAAEYQERLSKLDAWHTKVEADDRGTDAAELATLQQPKKELHGVEASVNAVRALVAGLASATATAAPAPTFAASTAAAAAAGLEQFNCPIGFERMVDPVVAADGHTYDREHIENCTNVLLFYGFWDDGGVCRRPFPPQDGSG